MKGVKARAADLNNSRNMKSWLLTKLLWNVARWLVLWQQVELTKLQQTPTCKKNTALITPHKSYFKMKLATDFSAAYNDKSLGFNNFDRKGDV